MAAPVRVAGQRGRHLAVTPALPDALCGKAAALFNAVTTATRDGVAILGPSGELLLWNASAVAITGWSMVEAASHDLAQLSGPEGR